MERAGQLADKLERGVHPHLDLGLALLATLGGNQDDAVGATHAIHGGGAGILQHRDGLHAADVNTAHRALNAVDKDERVAVVPRADTADDDSRVFLAGHTRRAHGDDAGHVTREGGSDVGHAAGALEHLARRLGDGTDYGLLLLLSVAHDNDFVQLVVVRKRDVEVPLLPYFFFFRRHSDVGED